MGSYHYLVAGLPDIAFDGGKVGYTVENFRDELYPQLAEQDKRLIDLFFLAWDNVNILAFLRHGSEIEPERIGSFSKEALLEIIEAAGNGDVRVPTVPSYIYDFLEYYFENSERTDVIWEDVMSLHYYAYATKCNNEFISKWFTFNMNVNNILVALLARKYKFNIAESVLGDNEVSEALRTSGTRDFGLTGIIDYFEKVQHISDDDKLQEREHRLDEMRWRWLEDNSIFNYFTIEPLFVFLVKLDIIERWSKLDMEKGMQRYNEMIDELKGGTVIIENL